MAKDDAQRRSETTPTPTAADASKTSAPEQGVYGSGGSYGVGGGFDDDEQRDEAEDPDDRPTQQAIRADAQQDRAKVVGFEREVDPDAAPPTFPEAARTAEEQALAAKKQRGSRI